MQAALLGAQTAPAQCRAPCRRSTAAAVPAANCGRRSAPLPTFVGLRQHGLQTAQVHLLYRHHRVSLMAVSDVHTAIQADNQAVINPDSRMLLSIACACARHAWEHVATRASSPFPRHGVAVHSRGATSITSYAASLLQVQGLGASIGSRPSVSRGQLQVRAAESKDTSSEHPNFCCKCAGWLALLAGWLAGCAGWLLAHGGRRPIGSGDPEIVRQLTSCAAHVTPGLVHCRADHPA